MRRTGAAALLVGGLVLAGCGNGGDDPGDQPTPDLPSPTVTATADPTDTDEPTEPTAPEEPTSPEQPGEDLPGEAVEIYPYQGYELGVIGVAADDVLHMRAGPGVEFDSIAQLDPLAEEITATGHNRQLDDGSFWSEIVLGARTGWASTAFLASLGQTTDITSELEELPSGPTLEELGELVGQQRAGDQPPSSTVVIVDGPHEGALGVIVVDVTGYGDDALGGERLEIIAAADEGDYTVQTVEATLLCIRGTSEGLCL